MKHSLALAPLVLLAACSSQSSSDGEPPAEETVSVTPAPPMAQDEQAPATDPAPSAPTRTPTTTTTLTLAGLGDLRIGQPVPAGSHWSEKGAQVSDMCRVLSSPDYPEAYAIVEGDKVRRISISEGSQVKLAGGIGPGASEALVKQDFAFPATPHKYVDAPGKYLTAPDAGRDDPALRFEIGSDGKVSQIHVGTMPVLAYVEGCS